MSLVFGVAAALIGLAAGRHNTARTKCQQNFYSDTSSELEKDSGTICSAFAWVDVGLMALLWVLLAIVQVGDIHYRDERSTDQFSVTAISSTSFS